MNIKQKLREALHKKPKKQYEYGCVMLDLELDGNEWEKIQKMINDDDLYLGTPEDRGYGRELDPHVTILYGIHGDVPDEDVEKIINNIKKPEITLDKISSFENELFDVLKFDVESSDLHDYNKMFKELPHTTNYPNYHPHVTICYLKSGKAKEYIKKMAEIESIPVTSNKVLYSKPEGSKKTYKF